MSLNEIKISCVIIDDDISAVKTLSLYLSKITPNIQILATYTDPEKAVLELEEKEFDVLFSDIDMPVLNGFLVADLLKEKYKHLVFVTSFDHFALQAIKIGALDYLLKPLNFQDLTLFLNKLQDRFIENLRKKSDLTLGLNAYNKEFSKLAVRTINKVLIFEYDEIVRVNAAKSYTLFYFKNGESLLASRGLYFYEKLLTLNGFFKIHKSHLINLFHIVSFEIKANKVSLKDGTILPITKEHRDDLLVLLKERL